MVFLYLITLLSMRDVNSFEAIFNPHRVSARLLAPWLGNGTVNINISRILAS